MQRLANITLTIAPGLVPCSYAFDFVEDNDADAAEKELEEATAKLENTDTVRFAQENSNATATDVQRKGFAQEDSNTLSFLVNNFDLVEDNDADAAEKELEEATAKLENTDTVRFAQENSNATATDVQRKDFAQEDSNTLSFLVNNFDLVEDNDADAAEKELEETTAKLEKADSGSAHSGSYCAARSAAFGTPPTGRCHH